MGRFECLDSSLSFFRCHPQLFVHEPELLTAAKANCACKEVVIAWFRVYRAKIQELEIEKIQINH